MLHHLPFERSAAGDRPPLERDFSSTLVQAFPKVKPDDPAGLAVLSALQGAVLRIAASDPQTRRGDSEAIHRLRTSTRRLRSELRALESLVDRPWREQLNGELKWLSGLLGDVRDVDILLARLQKAGLKRERDGCDARALEPLIAGIRARQGPEAVALNAALDGERYRRLLVSLEQAAKRPALEDAAWEPCRTVLPPLAAAAWRRLKRGASGLRSSSPVEEFHELRKRAKRTRYTAELFAPLLGHRAAGNATRFIRLTIRIQDTLGEHQDAIVASREIECSLADHADDPAFVQAAESLLETQHKAARDARSDFFKIWDKLDRKRSRRWMKIRTNAKIGS
jgi:CHAD domain-containing protein